jgi:hypothetical protein
MGSVNKSILDFFLALMHVPSSRPASVLSSSLPVESTNPFSYSGYTIRTCHVPH